MTDMMDERLAAAARRWQAEQPSPPAVPLDRLDEPLPGRRVPWRPLLAAAAAVVVVGGGASLAGRLGGPGSTHPTGSSPGTPTSHDPSAVPGAVPWRDLRAGHPRYPHKHGRAVTPYDLVSATGHISGRVRPGDTLLFTTVLESSTDLPLTPCPDYDIAFGTHSATTARLNCSAVPTRDAHGRPYLPAGEKVRFAMQVTAPDEPGRQKVLWTLEGPHQLPGFYGVVRVTSP